MATDWNKWFGHEHPPALQKEWVLRSTWTDCPVGIQEIIERLWGLRDLGNDNYIYKTSIEKLRELQDEGNEWEVWQEDPPQWIEVPVDVQLLIDYLVDKGIPEKDTVIIHHWW